MPRERRVTIHLDAETYAQLEARGHAGQPLAAIVRQALEDYLARQPDQPVSPGNLAMTLAAMAASTQELQGQVQHLTARLDALAASEPPMAASTPVVAAERPPAAADTLMELQIRVAALTTRVEILEYALAPSGQEATPTPSDTAATEPPTAATEAPTPADTSQSHTRRGQRKLTPRQQRALRDKRLRGVSIEALMEEYGISRASVFRYLQSEKRG
jgi:hypothetical protein